MEVRSVKLLFWLNSCIHCYRLQTLELENKSLREEAVRCRSQTDKLRTEKTGVDDQLSEAKSVISSLQEEVTLLSDQERRQKECVQANQQVRRRFNDLYFLFSRGFQRLFYKATKSREPHKNGFTLLLCSPFTAQSSIFFFKLVSSS